MKEDFFNKLFVHTQYGICIYINVASNKQWHNCFEHTKKSLQTLKSKVSLLLLNFPACTSDSKEENNIALCPP